MSNSPQILLLGSGLCTPPLVSYLATHKLNVALCTRTVSRAEQLITTFTTEQQQYLSAIQWNAEDENSAETLTTLAQQPSVRILISMLPYTQHVKVAKVAIACGKVKGKQRINQRDF